MKGPVQKVQERPTEVGALITGFITAVILYQSNRDIAALATALMGIVPALYTAGVEVWRNARNAAE